MTLGRRVLFALLLICFVALIVFLDRGGYRDANGDSITLLDAFYYATVSVTTTGYGDIVPESERARFITTALVTPARVIFLILLVGTTLELLFGRFAENLRRNRRRRSLVDHYVVVGYGVKGKSAVARLRLHDVDSRNIVVIDSRKSEVKRALAEGLSGVVADSSEREALEEAGVARAGSVIIALDSDDDSLITALRVREINSEVRIISSCRDDINAEALRRAGVDSVVVSAGAAGRLLALASETPNTVSIMEDLLDPSRGIDIIEKDGPASEGEILLGVIQDGILYRWPDLSDVHKKDNDRIIVLVSRSKPPASR